MRILFLTLILSIPFLAIAQDLDAYKISNQLKDQLQDTETYHSVHILLEDNFDVLDLDADLYKRKASLQERAFEVVTQLQSNAKITQVSLLDLLHNSDAVKTESVRSYWIANVIFVEVRSSLIAELSRRSDVRWMDLNSPELMHEDYTIDCEGEELILEENGKERGLETIHAPELWELGYTGYGQNALIIDTGTDPNHPALRTSFRSNNVPTEEAWFALSGETPYDCREHGTHVCGTVLGLDRLTNDTIGVAYNAQWMASPHISCENLTNLSGTERLVATFQWSLDPDNNPTSFEDMPDAINNSWYDPNIEADCISIYVPAFNACEAAGIAIVFSAGNEGPLSQTITPPHNTNTGLVNTFTVGALSDFTDIPTIAEFSSRGPSICGGDSSILIKPEVSAPGVSVRSCTPDGNYAQFSGTSMACPHTVGALLLLKEAFPELTGTELKFGLYYSCTDLGVVGEDNTFGMGVINVFAAYNYLIEQGHTPVNPLVSNDVLLIDIQQEALSCDGQFQPSIFFENAGTENLTSLEVQYEVEGTTISGIANWTGDLAPLARTTFELPPIDIDVGEYEVKLTLMNPNNIPDERMLNNSLRTNVFVIDEVSLMADVVAQPAMPVCQNAQALLRSSYEGVGTVQWFLNIDDDAPLAEGDEFLTPPLTENTTYFVDVFTNQKIGKGTNGNGGFEFLDEEQEGLVFDCIAPFFLKTAKVYSEQAGSRLIAVRNEDGNIIDKSVYISGEGEQRITINAHVPAGENILFLKTGGKALGINTAGANFPYTVENLLTIKGSTNPTTPSTYLYFYDWEIEYTHVCGRQGVEVDVIAEDDIPDAQFSASTTFIDLATTEGAIDFTDESTNATSWFWDFGDGTTSSEQNPSHTYETYGDYTVSLTTTNDAGCTDAAIQTIDINDSTVSTESLEGDINTLDIYPNPTNNNLTVSIALENSTSLNIKLLDVLGRTIKTIEQDSFLSGEIVLDMSSMQSGIYYIVLATKEGKIARKVLKL